MSVLQEIDEPVLVDYQHFTLRPFNSRHRTSRGLPDTLLWAGEGGAVFKSGGTDHYADVRLQVCSETPPCDASQAWEIVEEGQFVTDVPILVLEGATGRISDARINLPSAGKYGIRAHCCGREAASRVDVTDGKGFPSGLESWLIQVWAA